jgi:aspartate-semialdehyde dehydrogenase
MKNIVVVGATGLVGEMVIKILEERNFPVKNLRLFSSQRSEGKEIIFKDNPVPVEILAADAFKGCDIAFFAIDAKLAKEWVPKAQKECLAIDKSSAFRLDPDVPLVIPEVNPDAIKNHKNIIAVPNCTTIPLTIVLSPLNKTVKIKRVVASSYQSVSGAGRDAVDELQYQVEKIAAGEPIAKEDASAFPHRIGANIIPQIEQFTETHYTTEEEKLVYETRKILDLPDLAVTATCVRVPVFIGHALAVNIEFESRLEAQAAEKLLAHSPGIKVVEKPGYPMPIDAAGKDEVFVGRVRQDNSLANGLNLWIVTDNLRKGAALNAVQIAEIV